MSERLSTLSRTTYWNSTATPVDVTESTQEGIRMRGAPGLLIFAGNRLVSHRRPHNATLTVQTLQPLAELGEKMKYFEVTILSLNAKGPGVAVGLSTDGCNLEKQARFSMIGDATAGAGTEPKGCGFQSSGLLFSGSPNTSQRFGSRFGVGDVIGCGYDLNSRDLFFTRNGIRIPGCKALRQFSLDACLKSSPTVTLASPQDTVLFNFESNFVYTNPDLPRDATGEAGRDEVLETDKGVRSLRSDRMTVKMHQKVLGDAGAITPGKLHVPPDRSAEEGEEERGEAGAEADSAFVAGCARVPPCLLFHPGSRQLPEGMGYFEVAVLQANRDVVEYCEFPDVRVGLYASSPLRPEQAEPPASSSPLVPFAPTTITLKGDDGFAYCGFEPRDLVCGGGADRNCFMEGDIIGVGFIPDMRLAFFCRNGDLLGFVHAGWLKSSNVAGFVMLREEGDMARFNLGSSQFAASAQMLRDVSELAPAARMDARMLDGGYALESDREGAQKSSKQLATETINAILGGGGGEQESIRMEAVQAAVMELQMRYSKEIQRIKNAHQEERGRMKAKLKHLGTAALKAARPGLARSTTSNEVDLEARQLELRLLSKRALTERNSHVGSVCGSDVTSEWGGAPAPSDASWVSRPVTVYDCSDDPEDAELFDESRGSGRSLFRSTASAANKARETLRAFAPVIETVRAQQLTRRREKKQQERDDSDAPARPAAPPPYRPPDPAPRVSSQRSAAELRVLYPQERLFTPRAVDNPWRRDASGNFLDVGGPSPPKPAGSTSTRSADARSPSRLGGSAGGGGGGGGGSERMTTPPAVQPPSRSHSTGKLRRQPRAHSARPSLSERPPWDSGSPSKDCGRSPWLATDAEPERRTAGGGTGLDEELEEIRRGFRRFRHTNV